MGSILSPNLIVLLVSIAIGVYAIFRFALDQFDKPIAAADTADPWKFVLPRYLTPRRQYLVGFVIYLLTLLLIFAIFSFVVGPEATALIAKNVSADTQSATPSVTLSEWNIINYPTFPMVVALSIVTLGPTFPWIKDFESFLRGMAHRIAYIPENMDGIFNYMRFSEFDLSGEKIEGAWEVVDVRRVPLDSPDLKTIALIFNRALLLYTRAGTFAGDLTLEGSAGLQKHVSLEVFKLYRSQIQNVGVSLQAITSRIAELGDLSPGDRKKAIQGVQRELIKSLEFLYVIFACAITGLGRERLSERLRALGFASELHPEAEIPWNPILQTMLAAAVVLGAAWWIAGIALATVVPSRLTTNIPTDTASIIQTLGIILLMHLIAIGRSLQVRTKLIAREKYYAETGKGQPLAYLKIFAGCYVLALPLYLAVKFFLELYSPLVDALTPDLVPAPDAAALAPVPSNAAAPEPADPPAKGAMELLGEFVYLYVRWTIVPALCGVMTAYTIDRPSDTTKERIVSGLLEGGALAAAALMILEWTGGASLPYKIFQLVLYGGLGFVLGYMLPPAVKSHWAAREHRLPDKIALLRTGVLQYFHDMQQFTQWLYAKSADLGGKRPLDVLAEESGPQRLIALVTQTRAKTAAAQP